MRIINFSDVHFNEEAISSLKARIIPSILVDLENYSIDPEDTIILFSGDLIDQGGKGYNQISEAFNSFISNFVEPIQNRFSIKKEHIIFTPGNHDIDRHLDELYEEKGLSVLLENESEVTKFQEKNIWGGYKRISPYKEFEREYHSYNEKYITNFQSLYQLNINSNKIGVLSLNTAWRSFDSQNDYKKLIIGEKQILDFQNEMEKNDINIGIMHHHFDWIKDFDKEIVLPLLEKKLDILFCGHIHNASSCQNTCIYGSILTIIAPATWVINIHTKNSEYKIGYLIVDIENTNVKIKYRQYSDKKNEFIPDVESGDSNGEMKYILPLSKDKREFSDELDTIKRIRDIYIPSIEEHFLSYNTDSVASKNINDIFVEPKIIEKIKIEKLGDDEEIIVSIDEIIRSDRSIILFGIKESGKSILLDKLLFDIVNNISTLRKIPILIDFYKIGNTPLRTHISRYLGIGIVEIDNFIKQHSIVLLVDNLEFNEEYNERLKLLDDFISTNNITVIFTSLLTIEKELPIEYLSNEYFKSYRQLFIAAFQTKQIRELTKKWFKENTQYYSEKKIEDIIKMIVALNLPRTPLSISMFLWIIEKQENFMPINQATMLDTFIEKLFKKHSVTEILSSKFNYQNKISLLSEIAFFMYQKGNENYSVKYSEILAFIEDRFDKKGFRISAKEILDHFIDRGILNIKNHFTEDMICFRFNCFFEYFLMQRIVFDTEFKEYVFQEKNYYYFENEIDYYTGLRRYDKDILISTINRIYEELKNDIDKVTQLENSYDTFFYFPKQTTITESINRTEVINSISHSAKPTEEELDKLKDELLENVMSYEQIQKKHKKLHPLDIIERKITIALRVLKNTEEIDEPYLKDDSFRKILSCVALFTCMYKTYLHHVISKKEKEKEFENLETLIFSFELLPLFMQEWLLDYLGTNKLEIIIQNYINYLYENNATDLEKFLVVYLYSDINGKDYIKELKRIIKNVKRKYIYDIMLFKTASYYFIRSKSKEDDEKYLELISEILVRAKKQPKNRKGVIIKNFIERKKIKIKDNKL